MTSSTQPNQSQINLLDDEGGLVVFVGLVANLREGIVNCQRKFIALIQYGHGSRAVELGCFLAMAVASFTSG